MRFIQLLFLSILISCTATGPAYVDNHVVSDGKASIYVIRSETRAEGRSASILVDGRKLGNLKEKGYLIEEVSAGEHTIEAKWWSDVGVPNTKFTGQFEAGETYFLRLYVEFLGYNINFTGVASSPAVVSGNFSSNITLLDEAQAKPVLKGTRLSN